MTLIEAKKENEKTRILFAVVRKKIWCKIELKQNLNFSKKFQNSFEIEKKSIQGFQQGRFQRATSVKK